MKKFTVVSIALASALFAGDATSMSNEEILKELQKLKTELAELKATVKSSNLEGMKSELSAIKRNTAGDNIKFKADLRTSYDNINYKYANGSTSSNKDLLSNRLLLGMEYQPREDLVFKGELAYNKVFGDTASHSQANVNAGWSDFDWLVNENLTDNSLKVKQAYMLYFGNMGDVPYTASFGRRPSTNGYPVNLRDDDDAQSPLGHLINVEFDGASFGFDLSKVTSIPGFYFKACLGRGLTNAKPAFALAGDDYGKDYTFGYDNNDINMYGFLFNPYDNGQYSVRTQFVWADNLIGFSNEQMTRYNNAWGNYLQAPDDGNYTAFMNAMNGMQFIDVGDYQGGTITFEADGIGDMISDFLDDTKVFVSYSFSKTMPNNKEQNSSGSTIGMLGSNENKTGYSWYVGTQFPCPLVDKARVGVEYNKGSKYWRSMTYGEDTLAGSKLAARGDAWEVYYLLPLLGKELTAELRYTSIKYDYTGSNMFFGDDGAPMSMEDVKAWGLGGNYVEKATDLRASIRYKY